MLNKQDCELAAAGDRDAFGRVWLELEGVVFVIVQRTIGKHNPDVRDVMQNIAMRLWQRVSDYNPSLSSFRSWVLARSRYLAIDHYRETKGSRVRRKFAKHESLQGYDGAVLDHRLSLDERMERERDLTESISFIDDKGQDTAYLVARGHQFTRISASLGVPVNTCESRFRLITKPQLGRILKRGLV
jgi:RNA polymerase sigma factor (sigma-70 family)